MDHQGGVSEMEPFLRRFFPRVLERMASARGNEYCLYDSQTLTAFTSSLYVAGLLASLVASRVTRAMGRQAVMLMGGALFFAGGAVTGAAVNIAMLVVGRMLLGFGVGFTNQVSLSPLSRTIRSSAPAASCAFFFFFSATRHAHGMCSLESLDLAVDIFPYSESTIECRRANWRVATRVPIYFKKLVTRAREIRRNKQKRAVSVFPDLRSLLTSLLQCKLELSYPVRRYSSGVD